MKISFFLSYLELYNRAKIRAAKRISNPGCYATSTQLLLAPLLPLLAPGGAAPTVFGVSGYSGAGTVSVTSPDGVPGSAPRVPPEDLGGGVRVYALTDHIHEREAGFHLSRLRSAEAGRVEVAFTPGVAPWFSGIISTASVPLPPGAKVGAGEIRGMYESMYAGERLVGIQQGVVQLQDVEGKQGWRVGGVQVGSKGDRVVVVVRVLFSFNS